MINSHYHPEYRKLIVGLDVLIPLCNGRRVPAVNFDNAATTPPFKSVMKEIYDFAPWYSSIHRGTGYKSCLSSMVYENSRFDILDFVKGNERYDTVIYVKNSTEAINKVSYRLCGDNKKCVVLSTSMEHHSNDLPWRGKYKVDYIGIDKNGRLDLMDLRAKLEKYGDSVKLVTVSGASNVTGYVNPIYDIARIAHSYNARLLVDGAQLVPHIKVDMKPHDSPEHIDFLVFSAHKMYAPFGIGVLVGPIKEFEKGNPDYSGGGTVDVVTPDIVTWDDPPAKEEAGTPNLMGVVALKAAIKNIESIGMDNIVVGIVAGIVVALHFVEHLHLQLEELWD
jgi:selenocysteine lyase/cysteine desulfurase